MSSARPPSDPPETSSIASSGPSRRPVVPVWLPAVSPSSSDPRGPPAGTDGAPRPTWVGQIEVTVLLLLLRVFVSLRHFAPPPPGCEAAFNGAGGAVKSEPADSSTYVPGCHGDGLWGPQGAMGAVGVLSVGFVGGISCFLPDNKAAF